MEKAVILNLWADETVSNGESLFNILGNHLQGELYSYLILLEQRSHLKFHKQNQSCITPKRLYSAPKTSILHLGILLKQS